MPVGSAWGKAVEGTQDPSALFPKSRHGWRARWTGGMILGAPGDTESETSVLCRVQEAESGGQEDLTGHRGATETSAEARARQAHGQMIPEGSAKCQAGTRAPNAVGSKGGRQTRAGGPRTLGAGGTSRRALSVVLTE